MAKHNAPHTLVYTVEVAELFIFMLTRNITRNNENVINIRVVYYYSIVS